MSPVAVEVRDLVKAYSGRNVVNHLSFEVRRGEILAILGPNGAGKTTTVETLEGYRVPDGGCVRVLGLDPVAEGARLKPQIGVMLQEGGLYPAITAQEALSLFAHFYESTRNVDELLRLVGLEEARAVRYRRLSGGQKRRLALALALLPNPRVAFLDEPTSGMDPQGRRLTWDIIRQLKDSEVTVILTTHYVEEAERLADRVAIINHGQLIALDSPGALVRSDSSIMTLRIAAAPADQDLMDGLTSLPSVAKVERIDKNGTYQLRAGDPTDLAVEVSRLLKDLDLELTEMRVGRGNLEEVYLELTREEPEG